MRWKAHQRVHLRSTTGREGVQEGLTMEGIVIRIKETKTRTKQINRTELQNLKVQQQQQHQRPKQHQHQHQQQNGHEGVEKWAQVKGGTSQ